MILVDTGAFVALFDKNDPYHVRCQQILKKRVEPLITTTPVLTEAFHLLSPNSQGANALRIFISAGGIKVWFFDTETLQTAFKLMEKYADRPMDFADASLVTAAQSLKTTRIFTVDRNDFTIYRVQIGYELKTFEIEGNHFHNEL